ncbi:MAG: hypothetical protein D6765_15410 [Bacteroidetes bacterium]|nr:MAG: hypothetical protein D6765_15410 [Bacteroidota bacterium]
MKTAIPLLLCAFPLLCFAQTAQEKALEAALTELEGRPYALKALELSDYYFERGEYAKAAVRARRAFQEAEDLGETELMAQALYKAGRALRRLPNANRAQLNRAEESLRRSLRLTQERELETNILRQLYELALQRNRKKDAAEWAVRLQVLTGEAPADAPEIKGGLFGGKRKKALEKVAEVAAENRELEEKLQKVERERKKLRISQEVLADAVREKEAAIQEMTEEQMRAQLMLMEKERLLDSMSFASMMDSMFLAHQDMKIEEQKAQIRAKNNQRNFMMALAAIVLIVAFGLWSRYTHTKRYNAVLEEKNRIIQEEKKRSEELLLNILPKAIAEELKFRGAAQARHYEKATVLFTDFVNFSKLAKELSPEELVKNLDHCFKHFDAIVEKYGLEKIKTIGDAYMCAGGLPQPDDEHPYRIVEAALEMQRFLTAWRLERAEKGLPEFVARIGIHSGPLVAGVVGRKKFAYDIWGDTVNLAARLESKGAPGRVNISAATYSLVKDRFPCEHRGKVAAKNVGEIDMYFVKATG